MATPQRHTITIELNAPSGESPSETADWLTRFFSYYHPSLQAVVQSKKQSEDKVSPPVGVDLLS